VSESTEPQHSEASPQHTPGPWGYRRIQSGEFIITDLRPPLPGFRDSSVGKMGLNEADARLTAAAPDLLAALKRLMTDFRKVVEPLRWTPVRDVDVTIREAAAAIAKAEGRDAQ
jgi:hypothetical protein